jgi:hypothetical protein
VGEDESVVGDCSLEMGVDEPDGGAFFMFHAEIN